MKALTQKHPQSRFDWLNPLMTIAILMIALPACSTSKAKGKISSSSLGPHVGIVKGQLDAGVKVTLTVKNVGESGFIYIQPKITTSEGEWSRSQNVEFNAGETMTLTYFFDEPTINATNVQCRIGISPAAD